MAAFSISRRAGRLLPAARGFIIGLGESNGTSMAKFFCCCFCCVEIEPVKLADGTAALICVECDIIALEHEYVLGGSAAAAGLRDLPRPRRSTLPRK
jgi:hypothetical protein